MKLFAPSYYKKFKCIADRCRHSCCVGWEIDLDGEALSRYRNLGEDGKAILESVDLSAEPPHFRLAADERCPHLDERGLCRIISRHGEGYLCDICREHPRFYNFLPERCEVGIGASCEEAARLILDCESYALTEEIGEIDGDFSDADFDAVFERERLYAILSDSSISYEERLSRISESWGVTPKTLSDGDWRGVIEELEYLNDENREIFLSYSSNVSAPFPVLSERALAYFVYRHCTAAWDEEEFFASLGFALFCERLICSLAAGGLDVHEAARIVSEELEYSEDNTEALTY